MANLSAQITFTFILQTITKCNKLYPVKNNRKLVTRLWDFPLVLENCHPKWCFLTLSYVIFLILASSSNRPLRATSLGMSASVGSHSYVILVPRGRAPFGQHQESRPLAMSNTGSPRFTDFPSLCACSESSLTNLIGSGLNLLCFQSHSKTECRWTGPEVAILGADQKERGLCGRECSYVYWLRTSAAVTKLTSIYWCLRAWLHEPDRREFAGISARLLKNATKVSRDPGIAMLGSPLTGLFHVIAFAGSARLINHNDH